MGAVFRKRGTWKQLAKFGLVGGSGYLINLAVFDVLTGFLGTPLALAAIGAFAVAVTTNFLWNRRWTFAANADPSGFQAARFFVVSIASLALNLAALASCCCRPSPFPNSPRRRSPSRWRCRSTSPATSCGRSPERCAQPSPNV